MTFCYIVLMAGVGVDQIPLTFSMAEWDLTLTAEDVQLIVSSSILTLNYPYILVILQLLERIQDS